MKLLQAVDNKSDKVNKAFRDDRTAACSAVDERQPKKTTCQVTAEYLGYCLFGCWKAKLFNGNLTIRNLRAYMLNIFPTTANIVCVLTGTTCAMCQWTSKPRLPSLVSQDHKYRSVVLPCRLLRFPRKFIIVNVPLVLMMDKDKIVPEHSWT